MIFLSLVQGKVVETFTVGERRQTNVLGHLLLAYDADKDVVALKYRETAEGLQSFISRRGNLWGVKLTAMTEQQV